MKNIAKRIGWTTVHMLEIYLGLTSGWFAVKHANDMPPFVLLGAASMYLLSEAVSSIFWMSRNYHKGEDK